MSSASDRLRRLIVGLEGGRLPDDLRLSLLRGLRLYRDHGGDLSRLLNLAPPSRLEQRDEILRMLGRIAGGKPWDQAQRVHEWLEWYREVEHLEMWDRVEALDRVPRLAVSFLDDLVVLRATKPLSARQLSRILAGDRAAA